MKKTFSCLVVFMLMGLVGAYETNQYGEITSQNIAFGGNIMQKCLQYNENIASVPYACEECTAYITIKDGINTVKNYQPMADEGEGYFSYAIDDINVFKLNYQYTAYYTCIDSNLNNGTVDGTFTIYPDNQLPLGNAETQGVWDDFTNYFQEQYDDINSKIVALRVISKMPGAEQYMGDLIGWEQNPYYQFINDTQAAAGIITGAGSTVKAALTTGLNILEYLMRWIADPVGFTVSTVIPDILTAMYNFIIAFWLIFAFIEMFIIAYTIKDNPNLEILSFMKKYLQNHLNIVNYIIMLIRMAFEVVNTVIITLLQAAGLISPL